MTQQTTPQGREPARRTYAPLSPEEIMAQMYDATVSAGSTADRRESLGTGPMGTRSVSRHQVGGGAPADLADERTLRLYRFEPKDAHPVAVDAVRPDVVASVSRVPHVSTDSDRAMLSIGFNHALWCFAANGAYDPLADLDEVHLETFRRTALSHLPEHTQATHLAALRRLRRGRRASPGLRRKYASAPYRPSDVQRLEAVIARSDTPVGDARMLWTLTRHAGLRPAEVTRARVGWLERAGKDVVVLVPDYDGSVREVPVLGAPGRWLIGHLAVQVELDPGCSRAHLFRPRYRNRRNVISDFKRSLSRVDAAFSDFDATRARHTWLVELLTRHVPFHAVCEMGGIGRDSNLPTDLVPYMPVVAGQDVRSLLRRALSMEAAA